MHCLMGSCRVSIAAIANDAVIVARSTNPQHRSSSGQSKPFPSLTFLVLKSKHQWKMRSRGRFSWQRIWGNEYRNRTNGSTLAFWNLKTMLSWIDG